MYAMATILLTSPTAGAAMAYLVVLALHCGVLVRFWTRVDVEDENVPFAHGLVAAGAFAGGFGPIAVSHLVAARRAARSLGGGEAEPVGLRYGDVNSRRSP